MIIKKLDVYFAIFSVKYTQHTKVIFSELKDDRKQNKLQFVFLIKNIQLLQSY